MLLDVFSLLAEHPFRRADWTEFDEDGRELAGLLHSDWLVTYWVDRAVRRVLIVQIAPVDG